MSRRADVQAALDRAELDNATAFATQMALSGESRDRVILANEVTRLRKGLAAVLGRLVGGLMDEMEDGTPVLDIVFAQNPDLRRRLREAMKKRDD